MAKRLKIQRLPDGNHQLDDLKRIQNALLNYDGLVVSLTEAYWLWSAYSNELCASWLIMDHLTDDQIVENVEEFIEVVDNDESPLETD